MRRSPKHWYELAKKILLQIGFKQSKTSPCLFVGNLIEGEPPIYLGLYVDDFIYFSASPKVEKKFEEEFSKHVPVTFDTEIDYFLGIKFDNTRHKDGNVTIKLSQTAYIDELCKTTNLAGNAINTPTSPYRSGLPIDSIPTVEYDEITQQKLTTKLQTIVGSLNWLSVSTRPDISTVTSMLAKYCRKPSQGHIDAALRVIRYLKGTRKLKIKFTTNNNRNIESFLKFPLPQQELLALCDANWAPQDQSKPTPNQPLPELDLFKTRSMSGFMTWFHGPLMWMSKRQTFTARSSAEAEIYATDESAKNILHILHILDDLHLTKSVIKGPIHIWNDNNACVCWSKNTTTKGLRHVQIRENAVREGVAMGIYKVKHIEGKKNPSDIFTKEDKDTTHFIQVRNSIMCDYDKGIDDSKIEQSVADKPTQGTGGCQVGSSLSSYSSTH